MPLPSAILFSVALTLLSGILSVAAEAPALPAFMVIGTALWVYFDARRLGLSRYRTGLINPEIRHHRLLRAVDHRLPLVPLRAVQDHARPAAAEGEPSARRVKATAGLI